MVRGWIAIPLGLILTASGVWVPAADGPSAEDNPLSFLPEPARARVADIVGQPTFQVEIGPRHLAGHERLFEYLLDHLEICAVAGRALGLGQYRTRREADGRLFGDDGEGASGYLEFLHVADGTRIFFVDGTQKGLFTVGGRSVVRLDYTPSAARADGLNYRLHVWVRVDNAFFAFLSRLFLGMSRRAAEQQFSKMLSIPVGVTAKAHEDPQAVRQAFRSREEPERAMLEELDRLLEQLYPPPEARPPGV